MSLGIASVSVALRYFCQYAQENVAKLRDGRHTVSVGFVERGENNRFVTTKNSVLGCSELKGKHPLKMERSEIKLESKFIFFQTLRYLNRAFDVAGGRFSKVPVTNRAR